MDTRRDFLEKLVVPFIALPLFSKKAFNNKKSDLYRGPILRVAIMGLGSYGTRVADAMQACKHAKLVGLISGTPSKITNRDRSTIFQLRTVTIIKILITLKATRI